MAYRPVTSPCPRSVDHVLDYDRAPTLEMALHLASCEECREVLAVFRLIRDALHVPGWWEVEPSVWNAIEQARRDAELVRVDVVHRRFPRVN